MKWYMKVICGLAVLLTLVGYTRLIWLSGFDQGVDVSLCMVSTFQHARPNEIVRLHRADPACQRAEAYTQNNPLWQLRRRDGNDTSN